MKDDAVEIVPTSEVDEVVHRFGRRKWVEEDRDRSLRGHHRRLVGLGGVDDHRWDTGERLALFAAAVCVRNEFGHGDLAFVNRDGNNAVGDERRDAAGCRVGVAGVIDCLHD